MNWQESGTIKRNEERPTCLQNFEAIASEHPFNLEILAELL
jgi:hypothetical protein